MCQTELSYLRWIEEPFWLPLCGNWDAFDAANAFDTVSHFDIIVLEGDESAPRIVAFLRMVDFTVAMWPFEFLNAVWCGQFAINLKNMFYDLC